MAAIHQVEAHGELTGIGTNTHAQIDTTLANLNAATAALRDTGFEAWTGSGDYYSITGNQLTLLRGGSGYILGTRITWTAPQTAAAFTPNSAHWLYIDANGILQIVTSVTDTTYFNNIFLFEVHDDGVDREPVFENHPCSQDTNTSRYLHQNVGTVLSPVSGSSVIGSDMTQITIGTGTVVTDRQIKLVGTSVLDDHGLQTSIPDSAGAAVTWKVYYTNATGQWKESTSTNQFPMQYNNGGTVTALPTSGAGTVGVFTCYAVKAEPNSGSPVFLAVMNTAQYNNVGAAEAAIAAGQATIATTTLFQALEPARLGYVIVTNNATNGFISAVEINKSTVQQGGTGGGGASAAAGVSTNTSNFLRILSASDTSVQLALDTLDSKGVNKNGVSSGQTINGGTGASENLTLGSTNHATKGKILFGASGYDEVANSLGLGTASPSSTLHVAGSTAEQTTTTAADLTLNSTHNTVLVDSSLATRIITLPSAVGIVGRRYTVKDWKGASGTFNITINTTGGQTIDGAVNKVLSTNYNAIHLVSDGTNWSSTDPTVASGAGTVSSVSVVTANGFQGTVANPNTTPAITLQTSITAPVLKGAGNQIVAATANNDYLPPASPTMTGTVTLTGATIAGAPTWGSTQTLNTSGSAGSFTGSLSGDVTGTQSATAIAASTVTGKALTGFVQNAGTIVDTDTILQAIQKLSGTSSGSKVYAYNNFGGV